jgi:acyl-CoA synthetase (AMP-forming)/AMP-acid ligase II
MNLAMLLEMAAEGLGDRVAFGDHRSGLTYRELFDRAGRVAGLLAGGQADRLVLVDVNSDAVPIGLFGAAMAGKPFVPVNYRLADDRLRDVLARTTPSLAVVEPEAMDRVKGIPGLELMSREAFLDASRTGTPAEAGFTDPEDIAILLFTSGTTGDPKAAVLRHRHLTSYIISTVEFMGSADDEAALVSVPPYHIAGISAVLSSVYGGRRIVYLSQFSAEDWVNTTREQGITNAMVVPTMLTRILDAVEASGQGLPKLRNLSYGGGRMPITVIERAMNLLPGVGFVNAYGLTETASTIAVLTPEDHAEAFSSDDPLVRARLGSVGRPLPTLEVEIRGPADEVLPPGDHGEIWVRGDQVAGEYVGRAASLTPEGWFPTSDGGWLDGDGFLFVDGRLDDVIVRGGENLSPGEIEDVLVRHEAVAEAAVVGVPNEEWGEVAVAAVVVASGTHPTDGELKDWVRARLRGSRVPEQVVFVGHLPHNETGKLLRRVLKQELIIALELEHHTPVEPGV